MRGVASPYDRARLACGGLLVIASVAVAVVHAAARQDIPVFSARVETVRVDVSVRRGSDVVRGLRASDFEVFDNGVSQEVELVGFETTPVGVVLALDMSASVQGERLEQLREASTRLLHALKPGDTAGLVTFGNRVMVRSPLTSDVPALAAALRDAPPVGDTALIDATHAALVLGDSDSGRPLVIVFSDGADTASFLSAERALDSARRTGAVVYAVTTSRAARTAFLDDLVRLTGGRRLSVDSPGALNQAFTTILEESRQRYLLSYTPRGVPAAGWHELKVRVRVGGAQVQARPGYLAGNESRELRRASPNPTDD
jgi:VWFA-related protein